MTVSMRWDMWVPEPTSRAALRLFCLPYAGGGSAVFRGWRDALAPKIDVLPAMLPGRESRLNEPAVDNMAKLVDALATALVPLIDRPFALFGHSMGSAIAFETALTLGERTGRTPVALLVSGGRAPHLPPREPPAHSLDDATFKQRLRELNGTPQAVLENEEFLEFMLPMLRSDFRLIETYLPSPSRILECPLVAFGGDGDLETSSEDLEAWAIHTRGPFTLHMLPGDHFFIHSERARLLGSVASALGERRRY